MLELALLGAMMLLLLSLIVSFGLDADYKQAGMMKAFREALRLSFQLDASGRPIGRASYASVRDRYFADPTHPLALGSSVTVVSSGSVTRDYQLDLSPEPVEDTDGDGAPDGVRELPRVRVDVQGVEANCGDEAKQKKYGPGCLTTGFRDEFDVPDAVVEKYDLIYGMINVFVLGDGSDKDKKNLRITDSCNGEFIDYAACVTQARQIIDEGVCATYCERGKLTGTDGDCDTICGLVMNPPNQVEHFYDASKGGAWYADDWRLVSGTEGTNTAVYEFPLLRGGPNGLFNTVRAMGIQPDAVLDSTQDLSLTKHETSQRVRTTARVNDWTDRVARTLAHRRMDSEPAATLDRESVTRWPRCPGPADTAKCGETSSQTWDTPWRQ